MDLQKDLIDFWNEHYSGNIITVLFFLSYFTHTMITTPTTATAIDVTEKNLICILMLHVSILFSIRAILHGKMKFSSPPDE